MAAIPVPFCGPLAVQECIRIILYQVPRSSNQSLRGKRLKDNVVIIYKYQLREE